MIHVFKLCSRDGHEIEVVAKNIPQAIETACEAHPKHPKICAHPPVSQFAADRLSSITTVTSCFLVARGLGGYGIDDAKEEV